MWTGYIIYDSSVSADEFLSSKFQIPMMIFHQATYRFTKCFACAEHKEDKNDHIYDGMCSNLAHLLPVCATVVWRPAAWNTVTCLVDSTELHAKRKFIFIIVQTRRNTLLYSMYVCINEIRNRMLEYKSVELVLTTMTWVLARHSKFSNMHMYFVWTINFVS